MAEECADALAGALPALRSAEEALNVLTKKDISELKVIGSAINCTGPCCLNPAVRYPNKLSDAHPHHTLLYAQPGEAVVNRCHWVEC
jgi:hypothetical protein